jgi:proline racemase
VSAETRHALRSADAVLIVLTREKRGRNFEHGSLMVSCNMASTKHFSAGTIIIVASKVVKEAGCDVVSSEWHVQLSKGSIRSARLSL